MSAKRKASTSPAPARKHKRVHSKQALHKIEGYIKRSGTPRDNSDVGKSLKRAHEFKVNDRNFIGSMNCAIGLRDELRAHGVVAIEATEKTAEQAGAVLVGNSGVGGSRSRHMQSLISALSKTCKLIKSLAQSQERLANNVELLNVKMSSHMEVLYGHVLKQARLPRVRHRVCGMSNPFGRPFTSPPAAAPVSSSAHPTRRDPKTI